MLGHKMALQTGNHQQAYQRSGETAVVQAHAAVKHRHGGHHAEVHHGRQHTVEPAVFVGDGAEAVGIAQTHHNGLGMEVLGEGGTEDGGEELENMGSHRIAQHDGPDIGRMGTGIAGGEHTEDDAEGDTVEGRSDDAGPSQPHRSKTRFIRKAALLKAAAKSSV